MTKTISDKQLLRRHDFCDRISRIYDISPAEAEQCFSNPRQQSFWRNPFSERVADLSKYQPIDWTAGYGFEGYRLAPDQNLGKLATDGTVMIQNAASWLAVINLDLMPGNEVYDMCAAPGAKTALIAAISGLNTCIRANDASSARVAKTKQLIKTYNLPNIEVTLSRAEKPPKEIKQYDRILLDAPCSGDGLVDLSHPEALSSWSLTAIERLAQLQRRLLINAWRQLKPGGTLVYSTCTVAPEENEIQISNFISKNDDAVLVPVHIDATIEQAKIVPTWRSRRIGRSVIENTARIKHSGYYEAFYIAKLIKLA